MMKLNKKKVLVVAVAISLIALAVGGTLAWFTDGAEVQNTFTIGSIKIEQLEDFDEQTAQLLPVVGEDPTVTTDNYIQKKVTVKNVGKNGAYVQTYVAVPAVLDNNGIVKLYDLNCANNGWSQAELVATDVAIDGETLLYNVYRYRYGSELQPNVTTEACLEYVYIDKTIDMKVVDDNTAHFVLPNGTVITEFNIAGQLNVYVATQAIQAKGFADEASALDSGFKNAQGELVHPWAE